MDPLTPLRRGVLRRLWRDFGDALVFFTRLPVPGAVVGFDLDRIAWAVPLAGAAAGAVGAVVLLVAHGLGLPALFAAGLALAACVAATGGLHEDGLADVADGFGGGATRERRLEIMRDSRIGAYGATALALALLLRVSALTAALGLGVAAAMAALAAAAAVSRAGALTPLALLSPARADGLGSAARLGLPAFVSAWGVALAVLALTALPAFGVARSTAAVVGAGAGAAAMTALAARRIGGQTGDVAGAAQQWAEIGAWAGLLIGASPS